MTTPKKIPAEQMNLPLCETPPMTLSKDKQRELAVALADLLWNAAVVSEPSAKATGGDQS
jgi:hypothetical protein